MIKPWLKPRKLGLKKPVIVAMYLLGSRTALQKIVGLLMQLFAGGFQAMT